ncbi:MAG: hypothetical protein AB7P08_06260 [Burkholderiales bacterium]
MNIVSIASVRNTWKREQALFVIFCLVNLILGQIGMIWALIVAGKKQMPFAQVLDQQLQSANFAVFAVTLLVTTGTILIGEYLEEKELPKIQMREQKAIAAIVALILVLLQAMLTGLLVADSIAPTQIGVTTKPIAVSEVLTSWNGGQQVVCWILSMSLAIYIFCLSRAHKYPVDLGQERQDEIDDATAKAASMNHTSDNEKI